MGWKDIIWNEGIRSAGVSRYAQEDNPCRGLFLQKTPMAPYGDGFQFVAWIMAAPYHYITLRNKGQSTDNNLISSLYRVMPIGDPHGGYFEYTTEGLPLNVAFNVIPVSDISHSKRFYCELLDFEVVSESMDFAHLSRMGCNIVLKRSETTGVETGIFFAVDNPYNTRRRLIDQGVVFTVEPKMGPLGTYTSFRDDDGNIISVVDAGFMKREDAP